MLILEESFLLFTIFSNSLIDSAGVSFTSTVNSGCRLLNSSDSNFNEKYKISLELFCFTYFCCILRIFFAIPTYKNHKFFLLTHFRQFSWCHTYGAIFQHYFSSKRLSGSALILCHIIFSSGVSCSFITIGKGSSVCTFQNNVSFREQFPQVLGPNSPNSPKCGG